MKTLKTLIVLALFFGQIFGAAYAYAPSSLLETFKVSHKNNPLDDAIRKISRSLQRLLSRKKRKKHEATQTHTHTNKAILKIRLHKSQNLIQVQRKLLGPPPALLAMLTNRLSLLTKCLSSLLVHIGGM